MRKKDIFLYIFSGPNVKNYFQNESGSHRWQRVPPTETKGRVHTSSITVAIMGEDTYQFTLNHSEVNRIYTRGTGNGGQHKNTTNSCVVLTHIPTGISCRIDCRNQHQNERYAFKILEKRVGDYFFSLQEKKVCKERNSQIGYGNRSDKRRTYNVKANRVTDHITGKKTNLKNILKGKIHLLS